MKQINMLESPVRQVFFSYLVPSISATLVTSIYILADTMMIGRGVGGSGIAAIIFYCRSTTHISGSE